jgi:hypothetical protein
MAGSALSGKKKKSLSVVSSTALERHLDRPSCTFISWQAVDDVVPLGFLFRNRMNAMHAGRVGQHIYADHTYNACIDSIQLADAQEKEIIFFAIS